MTGSFVCVYGMPFQLGERFAFGPWWSQAKTADRHFPESTESKALRISERIAKALETLAQTAARSDRSA